MHFQIDRLNWISGNSGANDLFGNANNDRLIGGAGNDGLIGGIGNDVLQGDAGQDTFFFEFGDGLDLILDYFVPDDQIRFGPGVEFDDLTISQNGDIVLIAYGSDLIAILNADANDFVSAEFEFFPISVG